MLKFLGIISLAVTALYVVVLAALYAFQRKIQYAPTHRDKAGQGNKVFKPWKSASNGEFLGYIRPGAKSERAVIFFHGNGGEALDRAWVDELVPKDQTLVLAEYPQYGARGGTLSESAVLEDAVKMVEEIRRSWPTIALTAVGESMGSAVACYLSSKGLVERLGLIAPFTSAVDVAARYYRYVPVRFLMRDKFPSIEYVQTSKVPLHIVHGTLDDVVPVDLGKRLFESYPGKSKTFTEVPGFSHNNLESAILHSPFAGPFVEFIEAR